MKHYIRGVGSGLPLVKEYLDLSHGNITIEDNLNSGAVVTLSLKDHPSEPPAGSGGQATQTTSAPAESPVSGATGPTAQAVPSAPRMAATQTPAIPQRGTAPSVPVVPQQQAWGAYQPAAPQAYQPTPPAYQQAAAYPVMPGYGAMPPQQAAVPPMPLPLLSDREKTALTVFAHEGALGVTELSNIMGLAMSSTYALMDKMEESALIEKTKNKKRILTDYGDAIYQQLRSME
jgi:predicted transcriptional regulator